MRMMKLAPFRRMIAFADADDDEEVSLPSVAEGVGHRNSSISSRTAAMTNFALSSVTNIFKKAASNPKDDKDKCSAIKASPSPFQPPSYSMCTRPSPSPLSADAAHLFDDDSIVSTQMNVINEFLNDDTIASTS